MNRGGGLWTLSARGWFGVFAAVIAALLIWVCVSTAQPSASAVGSPGAQVPAAPGTSGSGTDPTDSSPSPAPTPSGLSIVEPPRLGKTAVQVLALLPVRSLDSGAGYQRTQKFGEAWMDVDGNGCDTRDDILKRDLKDIVLNACKVMSGAFIDPYTGKPMTFTRGNDTSAFVQIDHMVALLDAWTTGAQELSQDQRQRLANDPTNLLAVSDRTNQQKSAADAASWLPPFAAIHCEYAARQISVKYAYGLWVTRAEHNALAAVLRSCPDQPAYRSSLGTSVTSRTPTPTASPTNVRGLVGGGTGTAPYYDNCSAAYAAGVSRIARGAPGYRAELDRDDDGIACEG
ncbi:DUF1524 domain-containing protein [Pseudolysinimonas kribbensis]|uniref:Calcium-binding protein n=1 Tax=Pseudolysinimonas kribbensis TaxID=433641 RepID=A0ABQ6KB55_9MICO|nr:DUF1524 domain-containing protein [Pseudolysinimonas kribbensis]GMA96663.1 calcium-binding protein [Pseudolysinimonas kribbensis]